MTTTTSYYYSASRNQQTGRWQGWVDFNNGAGVTMTPDTYSTRREALAVIKSQHPSK